MPDQLHRVDLNLLVAYQALIEEQNVTRAAERLYITQPAMSKTLQRLRAVFDDPLFTRAAHGLVPTPKTEELREPLADVLDRLNMIVAPTDFDPAEAAGNIAIASTEVLSSMSIPPLLYKFYNESPGIKLLTLNIRDDHLELLKAGERDFSIFIKETKDPDFVHYPLARMDPVLFMRRDHPLSRKRTLKLEDMFDYPHVALYMPHFTEQWLGELDQFLSTRGLTRKSMLVTSQLLTALELVGRSSVVVMASRLIANIDHVRNGYVYKELPHFPGLRVEDDNMIYLIQHQRTRNSALHAWVRQKMLQVFEEYNNEVHPESATASQKNSD
jgi:DNA-binding transcriptional LysR family regulator